MVSVTPPRSTASRTAPAKPQRPPEPSELDSEEDSELTEGACESEPESVRQPEQVMIRNGVSRRKKIKEQHKTSAE